MRSDEVFKLYAVALSGKNGLKTRNDDEGVYMILRRGETKYLSRYCRLI